MTVFYIVRHALTADTGRILTGWKEGVPLTEEGRAQARAVGERLSDAGFAAIYSSPIERTVETARAIASHHDLRVQVRKRLGEVQFGTWTGRSLKRLATTKLWARIQSNPSGARFPDGESIPEVQSRAIAEMEAIRRQHPKQKVCVVSHGDVIRLIAAHYLGVHIDLYQRIHVGAASVSVIGVSDSGPHVLALNVPAESFGGRLT